MYNRDLRIMRTNLAFTTLFQMPSKALQGRLCYELLYDRNSPCEDCRAQEVFRIGKPLIRERCIQLPNGRTPCFEVHSYPVKDAEGTTIEAVEHARDITERKSLERELKNSEERYRTIVELAREGIFILDSEARVVFANQCFTDLLGYGLDEIVKCSRTLCGCQLLRLLSNSAGKLAVRTCERRVHRGHHSEKGTYRESPVGDSFPGRDR